jgi:(p)ppGpp synthase/HD superfamily hydrolase
MNIVEIARKHAFEAHEAVNHLYDGQPYSVHLIMASVAGLNFMHLIESEDDRSNVAAAIYEHDTLEDTPLTFNDLKKATNEVVAELAYACTNEKGRNRAERANDKYYEGIKNTKFATFVKLCDRIANVQYSLEKNSRMIELYRKEHSHFVSKLYVPGEYEPMWAFLEYLLDPTNIKIHI